MNSFSLSSKKKNLNDCVFLSFILISYMFIKSLTLWLKLVVQRLCIRTRFGPEGSKNVVVTVSYEDGLA